ncbi:MAG: hypothetical protein QXH07_03200 [Thermoplasmata archaeon]
MVLVSYLGLGLQSDISNISNVVNSFFESFIKFYPNVNCNLGILSKLGPINIQPSINVKIRYTSSGLLGYIIDEYLNNNQDELIFSSLVYLLNTPLSFSSTITAFAFEPTRSFPFMINFQNALQQLKTFNYQTSLTSNSVLANLMYVPANSFAQLSQLQNTAETLETQLENRFNPDNMSFLRLALAITPTVSINPVTIYNPKRDPAPLNLSSINLIMQ